MSYLLFSEKKTNMCMIKLQLLAKYEYTSDFFSNDFVKLRL